MKKLFTIILLLASSHCFALVLDTTLQGTIGTQQIVMYLSINKDNYCYVKYFTTKNLRDINLTGTYNKGKLKVSANEFDEKVGKVETSEWFFLTLQSNNNITGLWKDKKGNTRKVILHSANIKLVKNPYAQLYEVKMSDQYDFLRLANMNIIQDSILRDGAYTLSFVHETHSKTNFVLLKDSPYKNSLKKVNDLLLNKLLHYALQNLACEVGSYSFSGPIIKGPVFSTNINFQFSCYYGQPDFGDDPLNLDLRNGEPLKLEDVLYISDVPEPKETDDSNRRTDASFEYHSKIYGPNIVEILTVLHPNEIHAPFDCDSAYQYNNTSLWADAYWYLISDGIYISPGFKSLHDMECGDPEWSVIPYKEMKKYRKPRSGIDLSE